MKSFKVGVLGATGAVGQKFIRLLQDHPWFTITVLGASERSAGRSYKDAVHWIEDIELPEDNCDITVYKCNPGYFSGVDFVFSGLDASVASEIEREFAEAGITVISNAKNFRMDESVPLLIPEINPNHISLINTQTFSNDGSGWIVTNPNCVCVPLAMSLRPFYDAFGIKSVIVTTMQSVSGAGYPGVAGLDIMGNVVPFIDGEEEKITSEPLKILGSLDKTNPIRPAKFDIEATAVRVPTIEGHLLSVSVKLEQQPQNIEEIYRAFDEWENPIESLGLPSAPHQPIRIYQEGRFPQPRLQAGNENGMQLGIGRLRSGSVFDISYLALAHNTIRGAAGGAILNAELLVEKGYLN